MRSCYNHFYLFKNSVVGSRIQAFNWCLIDIKCVHLMGDLSLPSVTTILAWARILTVVQKKVRLLSQANFLNYCWYLGLISVDK